MNNSVKVIFSALLLAYSNFSYCMLEEILTNQELSRFEKVLATLCQDTQFEGIIAGTCAYAAGKVLTNELDETDAAILSIIVGSAYLLLSIKPREATDADAKKLIDEMPLLKTALDAHLSNAFIDGVQKGIIAAAGSKSCLCIATGKAEWAASVSEVTLCTGLFLASTAYRLYVNRKVIPDAEKKLRLEIDAFKAAQSRR
jgi:hypothetical protein